MKKETGRKERGGRGVAGFWANLRSFCSGAALAGVLSLVALAATSLPAFFPAAVEAQTQTQTLNTSNAQLNPTVAPTQSNGFVLSVCDGPDLSNLPAGSKIVVHGQTVTTTGSSNPEITSGTYVPCDFNGAILQIQRLINAMIILGVFVALIGFCYAGYLYITGTPGNISTAHSVFKGVGIGFVIMVTAWFVVYQILSWLTGCSAAEALLGGCQTPASQVDAPSPSELQYTNSV